MSGPTSPPVHAATATTARALRVEGAFEVSSSSYPDHRGVVVVPFLEPAFRAATGVTGFAAAQTLTTRSGRHVARGLHYSAHPDGMAKYVYCLGGRALDLVVDVRVGSPTFGCSDAVVLDDVTSHGVYVPPGVGHGVVALHDDTVVHYLLSTPYDAALERTVHLLDPDLALPLTGDAPLRLSERDRTAPGLAAARAAGRLPAYLGGAVTHG